MPDSFELDGKTYRKVRMLSSGTGEADVILVERDGIRYALKIYAFDPVNPPSHEVLERVAESTGGDDAPSLLIRIYSNGKWRAPGSDGPDLDYELMQYCEGGALVPGSYEGDEEEYMDVINWMVLATGMCGSVGILHCDIKPQNFFWVDKEHTELVLGDFGIATLCPEGESREVGDAWTAIYASPEFYSRMPGGRPQVDARSDAYALGMSMLTLISGESQFAAMTEPALLRMKQEQSIPLPDSMPERIKILVSALTEPLPSRRCDVARALEFLENESDGDVDAAADAQPEEPQFEISFNAKRGLVAHTCEELAVLMLDDPKLARKYLYSGRVARWLDEAGLSELAVAVEEAVEGKFPKDQEAGLWTALWTIHPDIPFEEAGVKDYMADIASPQSRILIYMRTHDLEEYAEEAEGLLDACMDPYDVLKVLKYQLFPDEPYPLTMLEKGAKAHSLQEMLDYMAAHDGPATYLNTFYFPAWLAKYDMALAGKVREIVGRGGSHWEVVYALSPQMGINCISDPSDPDRAFTPKEVGEWLNRRIFEDGACSCSDYEDVLHDLDLETGGRLDAYLASKQKYGEQSRWCNYCLGTKYYAIDPKRSIVMQMLNGPKLNNDQHDALRDEDLRKYGPFDVWYAIFKMIKGLGADPFIILREGDEPVRTPQELLKRYSREQLQAAMADPSCRLGAWLATFFQEDPHANLKPALAYEKLTEKYLRFIDDNIGNYAPAARFRQALADVDAVGGRVRGYSLEKGALQFLIFPLTLIVLAVCGVSCFGRGGIPPFNPVEGHFWGLSCLIAAALVGWSYAKGFTWTFWWRLGVSLCIGAAATFGLRYLFDAWPGGVRWVVFALILAAIADAVVFTLRMSRRKPYVGANEPDPHNPGFRFRELEALHYAYKNDGSPFRSSLDSFASSYILQSRAIGSRALKGGFFRLGVAVVLLFLVYFLNPAMSDERSLAYPSLHPLAHYVGAWTGTLEGSGPVVLTIDSVNCRTVCEAAFDGASHSVALVGSCRTRSGGRLSIELAPAAEADSLSPLVGRYLLESYTQRDTLRLRGNFIPARGTEIIPAALTLTYSGTDADSVRTALREALAKKSAAQKSKTARRRASRKSAASQSQSAGSGHLWKDTMGEDD